MSEIDIKDEEFSGLRLKLEELLRFGWKFHARFAKGGYRFKAL